MFIERIGAGCMLSIRLCAGNVSVWYSNSEKLRGSSWNAESTVGPVVRAVHINPIPGMPVGSLLLIIHSMQLACMDLDYLIMRGLLLMS